MIYFVKKKTKKNRPDVCNLFVSDLRTQYLIRNRSINRRRLTELRSEWVFLCLRAIYRGAQRKN